MGDRIGTSQRISGSSAFEAELRREAAVWQSEGRVGRLWAKDATLWTGADEARWMGWLDVVGEQAARLDALRGAADLARQGEFADVLLLGMGGSSLCPEVLAKSFGRIEGFPSLRILDSTDPAQVRRIGDAVDLERCLFIVSSKSGSTLEPNIFNQHFFDVVRSRRGADAGARFLAVTDPGSMLERVATTDGFACIFAGIPSIGGRYSALSDFGMVPATVMGIDVAGLVERADAMAKACSAGVPVEENPGVMLGLALGVAGLAGRDKVTISASSGVRDLGAWLEQLLAESTGKLGKGLIPVDAEDLGPPEVYGTDRVFVDVRLDSAADDQRGKAVDALARAGHPVIRIAMRDAYDLAQEFFRWEIATAVAGAVLGINPFDQPDVEASKVATRQLTDEYEARGSLPAEEPFVADGGLALFADSENVAALRAAARDDGSVRGIVQAHLARLAPGDYCALLAYVDMNPRHWDVLQAIRHMIRDASRVATCLGFGPRFLHSTGQAYKGGPNTGVFLQLTCDDAEDVPVPGKRYTFGIVKAAQARGDFTVLAERKRRVLRVHLGPDVGAGLNALKEHVASALNH